MNALAISSYMKNWHYKKPKNGHDGDAFKRIGIWEDNGPIQRGDKLLIEFDFHYHVSTYEDDIFWILTHNKLPKDT